MAQLVIGLGVILFGLLVGGVGLASAGVGIGIPMIPIGIYIAFRGARIIQHEKRNEAKADSDHAPLEPLENTKIGKTGIGIILVLVGVGASAFLVGIPIFFVGLWFIYSAWRSEIRALLDKQNQTDA